MTNCFYVSALIGKDELEAIFVNMMTGIQVQGAQLIGRSRFLTRRLLWRHSNKWTRSFLSST